MKILKSWGTDGSVVVSLLDTDPEELKVGEQVFIEFDGLPVPFFIESIQPKGGKAIVHITDVDNLEDAEEIVGRAVYADYFEEEDDGEDFTGWTVYDKGREVGVVSGEEAIPGNPCLVVSVGKGVPSHQEEVLIPLHEDFVVQVDEPGRRLYMDLPEGLI